jgi:hypothetical protein
MNSPAWCARFGSPQSLLGSFGKRKKDIYYALDEGCDEASRTKSAEAAENKKTILKAVEGGANASGCSAKPDHISDDRDAHFSAGASV